MYKTLMLLLMLVVSAAWVIAQDNPQSKSAEPRSGQTTVQGCLSGTDGNYTLAADSGTTYQLTGNTAELKDHVGHEVQITGTTAGSSMASSSSGQATLDMKSMKHISKTCKSAAK